MRYSEITCHSILWLSIVTYLTVGLPKAHAAQICPCDIYASGGTPCVAAHSTVRALYGSYDGPLYQVKRKSDGKTKDIGVLAPGGFANSAAQDSFLSGTTGTFSIIYDQSGKSNHLKVAPGGGAKPSADVEASATGIKLWVGGHHVYGVFVAAGTGYRNNNTSGIATGDLPEGEYMVASGKHVNNGCCFDYGNAETNNKDNGNGTMEAIYLGTSTYWGHGSGSGPWVMADLENGLFAGGSLVNNNNTPVPYDYVAAMIKGKQGRFAIKGGNAQSGNLKTMYDGNRPTTQGYNPMKKEGAIILGIGGDNSNSAVGTFFEGAMTSGYPSDSTENEIQANIIAAGYGSDITKIRDNLSDADFNLRSMINCVNSKLRVEFTASVNGAASLRLYDLKGNVLKTSVFQARSGEVYCRNFDLSNITEGFYVVKIGNGNSTIRMSKILVTK